MVCTGTQAQYEARGELRCSSSGFWVAAMRPRFESPSGAIQWKPASQSSPPRLPSWVVASRAHVARRPGCVACRYVGAYSAFGLRGRHLALAL